MGAPIGGAAMAVLGPVALLGQPGSVMRNPVLALAVDVVQSARTARTADRMIHPARVSKLRAVSMRTPSVVRLLGTRKVGDQRFSGCPFFTITWNPAAGARIRYCRAGQLATPASP